MVLSSNLKIGGSVRPLQESDLDSWLELWRGYQAYYEVHLTDLEQITFDRMFSENPDGPFALVFESDEGELLGLVHYLFHLTTWTPKKRLYLQDLFTTKIARGKGVGRALIEAVYEEGDKHQASQVYWLTQDFNTEGRRLYDKVATKTPFIKYAR